jgi:hypothetical protein
MSLLVSAGVLWEENSQPTTASPTTTTVAPMTAIHRKEVDFEMGFDSTWVVPAGIRPKSESLFNRCKSVRISAADG